MSVGADTEFKKTGLRYGPPKAVSGKGSGGILPLKICKTEVLGNGISSILRSSQHAFMSLFNLGGLTDPPPPVPPQKCVPCHRTDKAS